MAMAGAIVSAIGTAANLGMGIWSNIRASKAKTNQVGVSGAQAAALSSARYTADRMSELGGMSAAQYQRILQAPDVQQAQTQQSINQIGQTPFQDSYQREALAKVMLSRMYQGRRETLQQIADIDAERTAANAMNAFQSQAQVAQLEAQAQAQRNAIIARNEEIQTNRWNTFANMLGNIGQMAGMSAEGIELALKEQRAKQNEAAANRTQTMTESDLQTASSLQSFDDTASNLALLNNKEVDSNFEFLKTGTMFD